MKYQVNLSRNTLIFYSLLAPFIIAGSIANLGNIISGKGSVHVFGAFALFGFVLLPAIIISQLIFKKCVISDDKLTIHKKVYPFASYRCSVVQKEIRFKDRPLFSLHKKHYYDLVIQQRTNGQEVYREDLQVGKRSIGKITQLLEQAQKA